MKILYYRCLKCKKITFETHICISYFLSNGENHSCVFRLGMSNHLIKFLYRFTWDFVIGKRKIEFVLVKHALKYFAVKSSK